MDQVLTVARGELGEQDARLDSFDSLDALHAAQYQHHSGLAADDPVDVGKSLTSVA